MAAEVAAQLTSTELNNYGNIFVNGYATTGPNTTGKLGWAWPDSPLGPAAPLPSVTAVNPALKGWTTNYQEYYTELQPNGYGVNPGDPTMFEYTVHSFDSGNQPQWSQAPRRMFQQQVSQVTLPQYLNNPQVIQYSFMYPVSDNPVPPPIGSL